MLWKYQQVLIAQGQADFENLICLQPIPWSSLAEIKRLQN